MSDEDFTVQRVQPTLEQTIAQSIFLARLAGLVAKHHPEVIEALGSPFVTQELPLEIPGVPAAALQMARDYNTKISQHLRQLSEQAQNWSKKL